MCVYVFMYLMSEGGKSYHGHPSVALGPAMAGHTRRYNAFPFFFLRPCVGHDLPGCQVEDFCSTWPATPQSAADVTTADIHANPAMAFVHDIGNNIMHSLSLAHSIFTNFALLLSMTPCVCCLVRLALSIRYLMLSWRVAS